MESAVDNNWFRTCGFKSMHTGGANFAMGDGDGLMPGRYLLELVVEPNSKPITFDIKLTSK